MTEKQGVKIRLFACLLVLLSASCRETKIAKATPAESQRQRELISEGFVRLYGQQIAICAAKHGVSLEVALSLAKEMEPIVSGAATWPPSAEQTDARLIAFSEKHQMTKQIVADLCWDMWILRANGMR